MCLMLGMVAHIGNPRTNKAKGISKSSRTVWHMQDGGGGESKGQLERFHFNNMKE